jgi:hypothetical protein
LTTAELSALAISGLSLLVAFLALYRAELRGPKLTLDLLEAPARWAVQGWRHAPGGGLYQMRLSEERPPKNAMFNVQITGNLKASVRNDGPRSGVFWSLSFHVVNAPTLFEFRANNMLPEDEPLSVKGKETRGFAPQLLFDVNQIEVATVFRELDRSSEDFTLIARYTANRGVFGRAQTAQTTITLARKALIEAVRAWERDWPKDTTG